MDERSQYKTALGLAHKALDYIAQYGTPPTPHAYAVFYTVCAGLNPKLNEALAKVIADHRKVTAADAERLHAEFLSGEPPSETMSGIGSRMTREMSALLSMLGTASASVNTYQASLQNAEERLSGETGGENVSQMIKSLLTATQTMARTNAEVSANLETSRDQVEQLEECLKAARAESSRDMLTGLVNRRHFEIVLEEAILASANSGEPCSLLVIDIDGFKAFNDTYGHMAGDSALRYVASCIKSNIKGQDTAGRCGGEEFAVLLPGTALENALSVAERIRHLVNARHLVKKATGDNMGRISVSVGVTASVSGDTAESFMHRADMCMYAAKHAGRNQVQSAPIEEAPPAISGAA